jgi:predicted ATPase
LNLSKLTRAQSSAIVAKLTGDTALPAEVLGQILSKTAGVPLYVEELTKTVLESGVDVGAQHAAPLLLAIPATLQDALMARLDRLGSAKEIAQIGAALGREFSYALLAAVTATPTRDLDHALEQLTDSGLAFRRGAPPEATYTFKHALVQDAAYDSLLKSRRQELHATIARVLAADFPQITATEPELLAHHLTAAGQAAAAIPFWQQAGTLALKRLALTEAIAHLNQGMTLIGTLPPSLERDGHELDLRTLLKGYPAPEVWSSLHPALELAKSLGRREALLPIYYGLWVYVLVQGRIAESLAWVNEMLATAEASGDSDLLIVAHRGACSTHFYGGDLTQSRAHGDRVLALYDEEHYRHLADIMNTDPKTSVGIFISSGTWMLGYPDRAAQLCDAKDAHARRRGHPFDLGLALTVGSYVWDYRGESEQALARAEEAERLGRAHSLPFISEVLAQVMKGIAWLRAGRLAEGMPQLRGALEAWNAHGGEINMPYYRAVLAEGLALNGDIEGGLRLIEESLTQMARPGWEERWYLAEVLRLKGEILLNDERRMQNDERKTKEEERETFPIHHSSFIIHHSSFIIHRSSFIVLKRRRSVSDKR